MNRQGEQKAKTKYEFENEGQYLIAKYREQIQFALFQVEGQYKSAKERKREERHAIKTFGIALLVVLLAMPAGALIAIGGGKIFTPISMLCGVIGSVVCVLDVFGILYVMPMCLFRVLRGFVYLQISKGNGFGKWLCKKWHLQNAGVEFEQCESYIRQYNAMLDEINQLEEKLDLGEDVELQLIKDHMGKVDTKPNIKIVQGYYGRVDRAVKKITFFAAFCILAGMVLMFGRIYMMWVEELKYIFSQM